MHNAFLHRVLIFVSFLLLTTSIFALPAVEKRGGELRRRAPLIRNPDYVDTNAKRLARGLGPLPPVRRLKGSGTDTAKRTQNSQTVQKRGKIRVTDPNEKTTLGYLTLTDTADRYVLGSVEEDADPFSATVFKRGITTEVNWLDPKPGQYLAGVLPPGEDLGTSNPNIAIVGFSDPTPQGASPQSGGKVSIAGYSYESAIWSFDPSCNGINATWVNSDWTTVPLTIFWGSSEETFYLTGDPTDFKDNTPDATLVTFSLD